MNNRKIIGIVIMAIAGAFMFVFDDVSGGIGFVSGIMMAIGLGIFLGWIPMRKK
ncbi:membrane protein [Dokdonia sp. 4H-3-7-5]|uniref:membrane protein n=1 Tax=Dokdonia sp. (strain 4H-3-7-5) TaxID=983548 RepID=UPI00020A681D|nr:membrane protein [Dokdonia sp. 4H-3-7-5]AEE18967.1 putative LPS biosynthesis related membrane protein [Dokdonia sp. 4H-3-7-5]